MEQGVFINGAFVELFAVFYIARNWLVNEKQCIKEFVKSHIWDILLIVMLVFATISTFNSGNLQVALWGMMIRHDGLFAYFIYASVYICAKSIKSNKLRRWILRVMSMLIGSLSINTVLQYNDEWLSKIGEVGRNISRYGEYSSVYFNINHFEYVIILGLMAAGVLVVIEERRVLKFIWLCMYGYELWGLIINNTFAGFVAVVLGTVFMAIFMLINDKKNISAVVSVILVLITVSIITDCKNEGILRDNIFSSYSDAKTVNTDDTGGGGRIKLWKDSFELIKEKPLLGYGPEGVIDKYINGEMISDRPHNEYIQHMLFLGIPAGIGYILALVTLFITMVKKIKYLPKEIIAMGIVVFAYCVSAFFGNTLYNTVLYFFIFLGGISVCGVIKENND